MSLWNPAFSVEEYKARLEKVQMLMDENELSCLLLNNRADVNYVTGIETCYMVAYHACIVPIKGDPIVIASDFEMLNALVGTWCEDRVTFPAVFGNPIEATCSILTKRGFVKGKIGIQTSVLTQSQYSEMKKFLPNSEFVPADDIMPKIKVKKSPAEIEYMKKAGELSARAMRSSMNVCRAGITDNDVAASAFDVLIRGGSEFMCIDPIVTVGERSGIPHSTFRRTLINPGDSVFIEIGACFYRYSSPLMRTVAISPVSEEKKYLQMLAGMHLMF